MRFVDILPEDYIRALASLGAVRGAIAHERHWASDAFDLAINGAATAIAASHAAPDGGVMVPVAKSIGTSR